MLNRQLGAVALLNQDERRTEMDVVFNDGLCHLCFSNWYMPLMLGVSSVVWANNGDAISRA